MQNFSREQSLSELAFDVYNNSDNYEVIENNDSDAVYMFFSSHGLYFPHTYEEFFKNIVENNRYEWKRIAKSVEKLQAPAQMVFVRDIYKKWCLDGISAKYPSQEKVYDLLKDFGKKNIITVGSSAGGYMAILFGCLLNAKKIFCFSPQISLHTYNKFHPFKQYGEYTKDSEKAKYLDLLPLVEAYQGEIYYFYPNKCQEDIEQYEAIKNLPSVNVFSMNRKNHGSTVFPQNMVDLLVMDEKKLQKLAFTYRGKRINLFHFSIKVSGIKKTVKELLRRIIKKTAV